MSALALPQWHDPAEVPALLLALPENRRNRALYLLTALYGGADCQAALSAALRLLLAVPELGSLKNISHWLHETLLAGSTPAADWAAWLPQLLPVLDTLHGETLRVFGEFGGMHADAQTAQSVVTALFARGTPAALDAARCCLDWQEDLRHRCPDWGQWLQTRLQELRDTASQA